MAVAALLGGSPIPSLLLSMSPRHPHMPAFHLARRMRPYSSLCHDIEFTFDEEDPDSSDDSDMGNMPPGTLRFTPTANMTVAQMKAQLKQLGQRHTGSKPQLLERLKAIQRKQAMGLPIHDMEVKVARANVFLVIRQCDAPR